MKEISLTFEENEKKYRIIGHYDNGTTDEENDFYSIEDLWLSVQAYQSILEKKETLPYNNAKLLGFEVYENNILLRKKGDW